MKITVLVDNNTTFLHQCLMGEPAASFFAEVDDRKILFDTGYSDIIVKNAEILGVDLSETTDIVLSHGHDDHARGLKFLTDIIDFKKVRVITHPRSFFPKYEDDEYIGSPFTEEEIKEMSQYVPAAEPFQISENCWFLGQIPKVHDFETGCAIGTIEIDGKMEPDMCDEDSAMVIKTEKGLVIVTGCSHSGICNIISYASKLMGETNFAAIIGGFHLLERNAQLEGTIKFLKDLAPEKLYPCHCICLGAKCDMAKVMDIEEVGVGTTVEI